MKNFLFMLFNPFIFFIRGTIGLLNIKRANINPLLIYQNEMLRKEIDLLDYYGSGNDIEFTKKISKH